MSEETKKCSKCGEVKSIDSFRKTGRRIRNECLTCEKLYRHKWMQKNKDYRKNHREAINISLSKYRKNNKEKVNAASRKWREADHERAKESNRRSYKNRAKNLTDGYIAHELKVRINDLPIDLIEEKRQQLQIFRLAKEFKRTVKEVFK